MVIGNWHILEDAHSIVRCKCDNSNRGERMKSWFRVKKGEEKGYRIIMHPDLIKDCELSVNMKVTVRFGLQTCDVKIIPSKKINIGKMIMTRDVIEALMLPLIPAYEIVYKDDEIQIGPIIGIVAARTTGKLDEKVQKLGRYVRKYHKVNGAIIAFSNEGIDFDKRLMFGYLYDPFEKKWIKGIYPFPTAIFKRASLKKELHQQFERIIGNRIFNSSTFTKWEMYSWFKQASGLNAYLPVTRIFKHVHDVEYMLERFGAAYIKPIKGMQGKGVAKIEQKEEGLVVQHIAEDSKDDYFFHDMFEAGGFLQETFGEEKFILQHPLELQFQESIIDFRVIMIKDRNGEWKNFGIMGRNGVKGHIVSNRHRGGKVEQAARTLEKMFPDKKKEYLREMEQLAIMAAKTIENCGFLFGKLGIDIGIDRDGRMWLIEINHRNPNDYVATFAGDKSLVNKIRHENMRYAKTLAGF
jgi:glutathione synthase/RimK-type ligase-like ATP-grasp enzyme